MGQAENEIYKIPVINAILPTQAKGNRCFSRRQNNYNIEVFLQFSTAKHIHRNCPTDAIKGNEAETTITSPSIFHKL